MSLGLIFCEIEEKKSRWFERFAVAKDRFFLRGRRKQDQTGLERSARSTLGLLKGLRGSRGRQTGSKGVKV